MYEKLKAVVAEAGIWSGARADSHAFLLSPSVYQITQAQCQELQALGCALHDCLLGLSQISVIAHDQEMNPGGIWRFVHKVFSTGVPTVYRELQGINPRHIPRLLKVDFMVNQFGDFRIAEIDGHNKHGLGYSTLGMRFRDALCPHATTLPGVVKTLAQEVKRLGYSTIKIFYADRERFYLPEFEVAKQEFEKHGVECVVVAEMSATHSFLSSGLFLDLPFLYERSGLYQEIISAYKNGDVEFIIPPKPFLGAKGVLALLRNDTHNEGLASLLRTFICPRSLELVKEYIPETWLVGRKADGINSLKERISRKRFVLKESISSGMKGTVFSDDDAFEAMLVGACTTNMNWILQAEVENQPQTFSWFEKACDGGIELKASDDWYMRVTAQYVNRTLGDIIVTACRDKAVHGGKACLQLGTVIT